jgi:hypothetical protein
LDIIKGEVGGNGRVECVEASEVESRASMQAELHQHAFDERRSECWL